VTTTSQLHREFSGRGQLLREGRAPIAVRYYIYLWARLSDAGVRSEPHETRWEWDRGQGFLTLLDEVDTFEMDVRAKYTLVLNDGALCVPTLAQDYSHPLMKYRVQCSPKDLLGRTLNAVSSGRSSPLSPFDAPRRSQ
jgi:hypothetical protein